MKADWDCDRLALWTCEVVNRWDTYLAYDEGRVSRSILPLRLDDLSAHYAGDGPRVGLYPHHPLTGRGRWGVIDIDAHDEARPQNEAVALDIAHEAEGWGISPLVEDSNGNGGFKLWCIYNEPVEVSLLRAVGEYLVRRHPGHEVFPKQWTPSGYGNPVRLPGPHHYRPWWSRFWWKGEWLAGTSASSFLADYSPQSVAMIPGEVAEYRERMEAVERAEREERLDRIRADRERRNRVASWYGSPSVTERPGDRFERSVEWWEVLEPFGWTPCGSGWTRPGKTRGISATILDGDEGERLYVHTANGEPLEQGRTYTRFAAWAVLAHGGDYSAAARSVNQFLESRG